MLDRKEIPGIGDRRKRKRPKNKQRHSRSFLPLRAVDAKVEAATYRDGGDDCPRQLLKLSDRLGDLFVTMEVTCTCLFLGNKGAR